MILVEFKGVEYALISDGKELSWVNARNCKATDELSVILRKKASMAGVSDEVLNPPKPKEDTRFSFKKKKRRRPKKKGGIAIEVKLKNRSEV